MVIEEIRTRGEVVAAAAGREKAKKIEERGEIREERESRGADGSGGSGDRRRGERPKRLDENLISPILEEAGALRHCQHYGTLRSLPGWATH